MNFEPVIVIWKDITTKNGWNSQEEIDQFVMDEDECIVYQSGFLYEEDESQLCLLNSYFKNKDLLGDITKIPKGAIVQIIKYGT